MSEPEKHWTLLGTKVGPIADGPDIPAGESVEVVPVSSVEEYQREAGDLRVELQLAEDARSRVESRCKGLEEAARGCPYHTRGRHRNDGDLEVTSSPPMYLRFECPKCSSEILVEAASGAVVPGPPSCAFGHPLTEMEQRLPDAFRTEFQGIDWERDLGSFPDRQEEEE